MTIDSALETTANISIDHPKSETDFLLRDQLLKSSLRDESLPWSYTKEYPLVLNPDDTSFSWCTFEQGNMTAHANLFPRSFKNISNSKTLNVGLIGNVATHPQHRGKGHMAILMSHLEKIAQHQNLCAIILWSDLLEFYQNLGFRSIGREIRFTFHPSDKAKATGIALIDAHQLQDEDLAQMLVLRPKLEWTLERSVKEFRQLLTIPETHVFVRRKSGRIHSWLVIGRGMDMRGVIHEWGARSAQELISDVLAVLQTVNASEFILLAPASLPSHWLQDFAMRTSHRSEHAMAMAKAIVPESGDIFGAVGRGFVWGLDSI